MSCVVSFGYLLPERLDVDVDGNVEAETNVKEQESMIGETKTSITKKITVYKVSEDSQKRNICECCDMFVSLTLSSNVFAASGAAFDRVLVSLTPALIHKIRLGASFYPNVAKAMEFALNTYINQGPLFFQVETQSNIRGTIEDVKEKK